MHCLRYTPKCCLPLFSNRWPWLCLSGVRGLGFRIFACLFWIYPTGQGAAAPFPADAGVVNVQAAPYNALGDGVTDDTTAIQDAIDDWAGSGRTLYFPDGVYRLSAQLAMPEESANNAHFLTLQGESRDGTILRLDDARNNSALEDFTDPATPRALLKTAVALRGWTNDAFMVNLFDLTLDIGQNNPGAIGLEFIANNQGTVNRVRIRSSDATGRGVAGIEMSAMGLPGPALLKAVEIVGFDYGLRLGSRQYSMTAEFIELTDQRVAGVYNKGNLLNLRQLQSIQSETDVPAVWNAAPGTNESAGLTVLMDATLHGVSGPAIRNGAFLYARSIQTSGYAGALEESGVLLPETAITERVSGEIVALFGNSGQSLGLPVLETPQAPWQAPADWINVADYGAIPGDGVDDSAAIQQAIDATTADRRTVYFPNPGNGSPYTIGQTIEMRGYCGHLIGLGAQIRLTSAMRHSNQPVFRLVEADPAMETAKGHLVVIERLFAGWGIPLPLQTTWFVNERSSDTLIRHVMFSSGQTYDGRNATGNTFFEDVGTHEQPEVSDLMDEQPTPGYIVGTGERFFARQLNIETRGGQLLNLGGDAWIFGLKTEHYDSDALQRAHLETTGGGRTELLGGLIHPSNAASGGVDAAAPPVFRIDNSAATFVALEPAVNDQSYPLVVEEIRGGVTRILSAAAAPAIGSAITQSRSFILPLYVGAPADGNQAPLISRVRPSTREVSLLTGQTMQLDFAVSDDGLPQATPSSQWSLLSGPAAVVFEDPTAPRTTVRMDTAGTYELELLVDDGEFDTRRSLTVIVRDVAITAPTTGLFLHYPLNQSSGLVVPDASGQGNHGDLSDNTINPTWMSESGIDGGALQMSDGDRFGIAVATPNFGAITFSSWIRIYESSHVFTHGYLYLPGIFAYSTANRDLQIKVFWDNAPRFFYDYKTEPYILPEAETWFHLAISFDGSDPYNRPVVYINGQAHTTEPQQIIPAEAQWRSNAAANSRLFSFGGSLEQPNASLGGLADEVRLYDRLLGDDEIRTLAQLNALNAAPLVEAGADRTEQAGNSFYLEGSAMDDGAPGGVGSLQTQWSVVSGPGSVFFTDANDPTSSVQIAVPGTYVLRLTADDGAIATVDSLSVTVEGDALGGWTATHFPGATGQWREMLSADPDRDGRPNLMEYAFATDPTKPEVHALFIQLMDNRLGGHFVLRGDDPDLGWVPEVSGDLVTWAALPASQVTQTLRPDGWVAVDVLDTMTMSEADRRFLRLRLTHPQAQSIPMAVTLYPSTDHRMFDAGGDGFADNALDTTNELRDSLIIGDTGANANVWRSVLHWPLSGNAFNIEDASSIRLQVVVKSVENNPASLGQLDLQWLAGAGSGTVSAGQYGLPGVSQGSVDIVAVAADDRLTWEVGAAVRQALANGESFAAFRLQLDSGFSNGNGLNDRLFFYSGSHDVNIEAVRPTLILEP